MMYNLSLSRKLTRCMFSKWTLRICAAGTEVDVLELMIFARMRSGPLEIYLNRYLMSMLHPWYSTFMWASNAKHNVRLYGKMLQLSNLDSPFMTETPVSLLRSHLAYTMRLSLNCHRVHASLVLSPVYSRKDPRQGQVSLQK
ncbi:hypothetical protein Tco_0328848 [Tanacetum coccineum]